MSFNLLIKEIAQKTINDTKMLKREYGIVQDSNDYNMTVMITSLPSRPTVTIKNGGRYIAESGDRVWVYHWGEIEDGYIGMNATNSKLYGVGKFVNTLKNSEIFNDYTNNEISCAYDYLPVSEGFNSINGFNNKILINSSQIYTRSNFLSGANNKVCTGTSGNLIHNRILGNNHIINENNTNNPNLGVKIESNIIGGCETRIVANRIINNVIIGTINKHPINNDSYPETEFFSPRSCLQRIDVGVLKNNLIFGSSKLSDTNALREILTEKYDNEDSPWLLADDEKNKLVLLNSRGNFTNNTIIGNNRIKNFDQFVGNVVVGSGNLIQGSWYNKTPSQTNSMSFKMGLSNSIILGGSDGENVIGGVGIDDVAVGQGGQNYLSIIGNVQNCIMIGYDNIMNLEGRNMASNQFNRRSTQGPIVIGTGHQVNLSEAYNSEYKNLKKFIIGNYADVSNVHEDVHFFIGNSDYGDTLNSNSITRGNAVCIDLDGNMHIKGSLLSYGEDYAEYEEWQDGNIENEDRRGLFVTLIDDKIKLANKNDEIWGIVSANPSVIGGGDNYEWKGKYLKDIFGTVLFEELKVPITISEKRLLKEAYTDATGIEHDAQFEYVEIETDELKVIKKPILNPDFDDKLEYIPRKKRPEHALIAYLGKLIVVDDGTCQVNKYCTCADGGIATHSDTETKVRVLKRLDKNHILVRYKS